MRIGIVGFGHLGQYLLEKILENGKANNLEIAFIWNRTPEKVHGKVEPDLILESLNDFVVRKADLIVEVSHPKICEEYGEKFLQHADLFVGSPTTFANQETERRLKSALKEHGHALYVPSGALWGAADIKKMADAGSLQALKVTMRKHPSTFRLAGRLKEINEVVGKHDSNAVTLYEGPVRDLCPLAPNNVNTMAAAATAGHNLGFDAVTGCLVSDPGLKDWHLVEVEVTGPGDAGKAFVTKTVRKNPAALGAVTGNATYLSFFSSLLCARNQGPGLHMC